MLLQSGYADLPTIEKIESQHILLLHILTSQMDTFITTNFQLL